MEWIKEEFAFERIVRSPVTPGTRDPPRGAIPRRLCRQAASAPAEISETERHRAVLETPAASKGPAFKPYYPSGRQVSSDVFSSRLMSR